MAKEMKITTLSELALDLKINKSKLLCYNQFGLLNPVKKIGCTFVFNKEETIQRLEKIKELKNKGLTLKEITEKLKK